MTTYIDVSFRSVPRDPSVELAIYRWVARLEAVRIEVQRADVIVEPSGRKRTLIFATVQLADGKVQTATTVHADPYVGVADTFRSLRRQLRPSEPTPLRRLAFA